MADLTCWKFAGIFLCGLLSAWPRTDPIPAAPPAVPVARSPSQAGMTADDLLSRLETSDENISTIQADVVYDKIMEIAGDQQTRIGKLYFLTKINPATSEKSRSFAIHFDAVKIGDRYDDTKRQQYIFDGEWLTERMPDARQIIRRQVVKPGEKFDPLKIGEGPLPIPIGQKKSDILSRYDVRLVDAAEGLNDPALREFAKDAWQLQLIPKEGADNKFKEIQLWYREASDVEGAPILPRMARTVSTDGDIALVRLIEMKINGTIDAANFDTSAPDPGWSVQSRPFRE